RADGDHLARVVPGLEVRDIVDVLPEGSVGLRDHPVGSAEIVELVHEGRAEVDLECFEHLAHRDVQHLRLHAVDVRIDRGRSGIEKREDADEPRGLVGTLNHILRCCFKRLQAAAALVLHHHLEATGSPDAAHGWGRYHDDEGFLYGIEALLKVGAYTLGGQPFCDAHGKWL